MYNVATYQGTYGRQISQRDATNTSQINLTLHLHEKPNKVDRNELSLPGFQYDTVSQAHRNNSCLSRPSGRKDHEQWSTKYMLYPLVVIVIQVSFSFPSVGWK
ncbi:hypothetical protein BDV24DRAFT_143202 [Aspergillus arachidicola]|uniref:Uncharacterized protein n=1 Tax=Aspergillus arachidicola TaxID=656916 RepID=A0A5N6XW23_9EURO|nr:hypothetical protein BDV24DRAFT_143202 [Aspergillus arachidicola]